MTMERTGEGRWMVREKGLRIGMVLGGNGVYVAEKAGCFIGKAKTARAAAKLLKGN